MSETAWADAVAAARLLAADPHGLGGAWLRCGPGPARDAWLEVLRAALPPGTPWRRLPPGIDDDRLLGGLDLTATLAAGRPVQAAGLLTEVTGGVLIIPMAERLTASVAGRVVQALEGGTAPPHPDPLPRPGGEGADNLSHRERSKRGSASGEGFAVILLDESLDDEEPPPQALTDRMAFRLDLRTVHPGVVPRLTRARGVPEATDAIIVALVRAAAVLGIDGVRPPLLALAAARAAASLAGRATVDAEDAALAARLVLAPRATALPQEPEPPPPQQDGDPPPDTSATGNGLQDQIIEAARTALPDDLLARLAQAAVRGPAGRGGAGARAKAAKRGRPVGDRPGQIRGGARLALIATLRAAAPWQRLRGATPGRIAVRPQDLRVQRFAERREATIVFCVDASGSQAFHRLAEAKGAVELLLADAYVTRTRAALVAFRGTGAELVVPPTRAVARARALLAGLPGGGGTPLALGLDLAARVALDERRRGRDPLLVVLTDGRPNIDRAGEARRSSADADALDAAKQIALVQIPAILVDTAPRPRPETAALATALGARLVTLPRLDARAVQAAVAESRSA